jgi:hypothetical protein
MIDLLMITMDERHYNNKLVEQKLPENNEKEYDRGYLRGYVKALMWVMREGDKYDK